MFASVPVRGVEFETSDLLLSQPNCPLRVPSAEVNNFATHQPTFILIYQTN